MKAIVEIIVNLVLWFDIKISKITGYKPARLIRRERYLAQKETEWEQHSVYMQRLLDREHLSDSEYLIKYNTTK